MGTDRYPLPWSRLSYDLDKEGYVVPLEKEQLVDAPHHAKGALPAYTPEYAQSVSSFYERYE
jgi:hypothetical protein